MGQRLSFIIHCAVPSTMELSFIDFMEGSEGTSSITSSNSLHECKNHFLCLAPNISVDAAKNGIYFFTTTSHCWHIWSTKTLRSTLTMLPSSKFSLILYFLFWICFSQCNTLYFFILNLILWFSYTRLSNLSSSSWILLVSSNVFKILPSFVSSEDFLWKLCIPAAK